MIVAVLGLGEAGRVFAEALIRAGESVRGYDPGECETPEGVLRAGTAAEAVAEADLVLALTTARFSVSAAQDCRSSLRKGALYIDLNASSPDVKMQVAEAVGEAASVIDGAVIGSVRQFGAGVEVLLSGRGSEEAAQHLNRFGTRASDLGGEVGDASRRKLLRSVFMKGLGALIHESISAATAAGEEEWVRRQIAEALAGGEKSVERLYTGTAIHARRRSHELGDSLKVIREFPGAWPVTAAARERHTALARESEHLSGALEVLRTVPTSAIGDSNDRLGFVGSSIRPVWECPQVSGKAVTVSTRVGDNAAIHRALQIVEPGDVLVVAAEGGRDRALIGDLIAERAKKVGLAGMVLDGPVRDVDGIADAGLPVWARGVSAAGPYKDGPSRLGVAVAIGNSVCQPGDIVVADSEGVLFIPAFEASAAAEAAELVLADEAERRRHIRQG